jgi:protein CpxP
MKKLHLLTILSSVLVLALSLDAQAGAGRGKRGPGRGFERDLKALDLTDKQREDIAAMKKEMRKDLEPLHRTLKEKHEALHRLWMADPINEGAIMKAEEEIDALHREIHKAEIELRIDVISMLTPEQRAKLNEMMQQRPERSREIKNRPKRVKE